MVFARIWKLTELRVKLLHYYNTFQSGDRFSDIFSRSTGVRCKHRSSSG